MLYIIYIPSNLTEKQKESLTSGGHRYVLTTMDSIDPSL